MRNIYKSILALAFASTLIFSGCTKLEDGPKISLRSAKARVAGEWKNTKYTENGVDIPLDADDKDDVWKIEKDGKFEIVDPGNGTQTGTWDFNSDKDKIIFSQNGFSITYDILRLANKEMVLQFTDGSDKYINTFEQ